MSSSFLSATSSELSHALASEKPVEKTPWGIDSWLSLKYHQLFTASHVANIAHVASNC